MKPAYRKIAFVKAAASGNDFVIVEANGLILFSRWPALAKKMCNRKLGIGADGVLLLEKSRTSDIKMRIFNADGSEAMMCGNGAGSAALYMARAGRQGRIKKKNFSIETKAGIIKAQVLNDAVKIKLTDPKDYQKKIPLVICGRKIGVNFIDTGVPHAVVFVEGIESVDIFNIGREIRFHRYFSPAGANVNFVQVLDNDTIRVRTYERGVEDETLACGTGAAASAITAKLFLNDIHQKNALKVLTHGKDILKVYFENKNRVIYNVWLEGMVSIVYKGEYDV